MSIREMSIRAKKVAAALAAVELLLAEEAASQRLALPQRPGPAGTSPWALAGRLRLMSARLGSGLQRPSRAAS